ncbi:MAG: hypothetical protein M0Z82_06635 [Actinomycetota bacterium]|nr:hypothetical protein [Actinomycetota bacterium]
MLAVGPEVVTGATASVAGGLLGVGLEMVTAAATASMTRAGCSPSARRW